VGQQKVLSCKIGRQANALVTATELRDRLDF
jgi:hypothetical protein